MKHILKKLPKSQIEFTITVTPDEYEADLKAAASRISERNTIKGFRPGKASYEIVQQNFGDIRILEEALQTIVQKNFFKAVSEEKLDTIGMPEIAIEKMAPRNEVVFKATVALMPTLKLPDITKIKVEKKNVEVEEKQVKEVLEGLTKLQPKEILKDGEATKKDKVIVDMEMFLDKVAVEGGQAKNHQIYLSEVHYIPGLEEKLLGGKKGETKEFTLKFPEKHYKKDLAGKDVDFKVKIHDVYELQYPELNDDFAKSLGQENVEKLREILHHNLTHEAEKKENQRCEQEIFEKIIDETKFDEIPDVIITAEKQKMFYELKADLERHNVEMEDYLKNIKKTEEDLLKDFEEGGLKRAKAALVSRQIAIDNNIKVSEEELNKEMDLIKQMYQGEDLDKVNENLKRPEVQDTIATTIQNRKVVAYLKEKVLGEEKEHHCEHC